MHNPNATSTAKIPLDNSTPEWARDRQDQLVALHTAAVGSDGGSPKSSPTIVKSSNTFDGTGDPGKP